MHVSMNEWHISNHEQKKNWKLAAENRRHTFKKLERQADPYKATHHMVSQV